MLYPLTADQSSIAAQCAEAVRSSDVLLHCVCGAGKTELVAASIAQCLRERKKVCFAIPRRQVVLELAERLRRYFPSARVTPVCGGYTEVTDGDLIICTTHQLYRYYQSFDLLILDEPDAFPFRGNPVLHGMAVTACRGHVVYLSATPDEELMKRVQEGSLRRLVLNRRPHGHPLPEPVLVIGSAPVLLMRLLRWLEKRKEHPRMVFVPTVAMAQKLHRFLCLFEENFVCTSRSADRDETVRMFRERKNGLMIATTIMERGVTIPGADICVLYADHEVFDEASLIQMAGRAGRTFDFPDGEVLFLLRQKSGPAGLCLKRIQEANRCAV